MAAPKRKPEAHHLNTTTLLGMMAQLSLVSFFEITVYTPDEYSILEVDGLFEAQLAQDPDFLKRFERVIECTLSLDNYEYQNLVLDLCGIKELAKKSIRYQHCFEIRENEVCVLNLTREVLRRVKPKGSKQAETLDTVTQEDVKNKKKKVKQTSEQPENEKQRDKLLGQLNKALENEDYRFAAILQKKLDDLKG